MAIHQKFPVRLSCGHLVTYTGSYPHERAKVWCSRCPGTAAVQRWYFDPARPTAGCGATASYRDDGDFRCTLPRGHDDGGKHHDEPRDAWFTARPRLRSGSEGYGGRRP